MKIYNAKEHRTLYSLNPDLYFDIEEEYFQLLDVLASERLNGHDRYTQWMMKLETRYKDLLETFRELDDCPQSQFITDMVANSHILEN